jgi:hypothetical protein
VRNGLKQKKLMGREKGGKNRNVNVINTLPFLTRGSSPTTMCSKCANHPWELVLILKFTRCDDVATACGILWHLKWATSSVAPVLRKYT